METTEKIMANFEIIDYSEKAIAVVGDTREVKDALKRLGGRFNPRLSCGAGWIFPKSKRAQVEALQRGETPAVTQGTKKSHKRQGGPLPDYFLTAEERKEFWIAEGETNDGLKMLDYHIKCYPLAVRLTDGRVIFCERVGLETSFCFGHGQNGITTEEESRSAFNSAGVARTNEDYFISENMEGIREKVAKAKGSYKVHGYKSDCVYCYSYTVRQGRKEQHIFFSDSDIKELMTSPYGYGHYLSQDQLESLKPIEGEDRQRVVKLYEAEEANRLRRVQNYLKRYGLSKLKVWTYLVD